MRIIVLLLLCACAASAQHGIVYKTAGSRQLRMDVFAPRGGGARPAVVCVHGGGWRSGERRQMGGKAADLARAGFVGVAIDYRKSDEAHFPAAVDDALSAVQFLRAGAARFGVDPRRIGIFGSSAGAHLALMVGFTFPGRPVEAVASWNGPADLVHGFTESGHISKYARDMTERFIGGGIATHRVLYERASPARRIVSTPALFLAHGEEDGTVPVSQSEIMAQAARRRGADVTLLRVRGGGHTFDADCDPPEREIWARTVAFFRRTLTPSIGR